MNLLSYQDIGVSGDTVETQIGGLRPGQLIIALPSLLHSADTDAQPINQPSVRAFAGNDEVAWPVIKVPQVNGPGWELIVTYVTEDLKQSVTTRTGILAEEE